MKFITFPSWLIQIIVCEIAAFILQTNCLSIEAYVAGDQPRSQGILSYFAPV